MREMGDKQDRIAELVQGLQDIADQQREVIEVLRCPCLARESARVEPAPLTDDEFIDLTGES